MVGLLVPLPLLLYFAFKKAIGQVQQQLDDLERVNRLYQSLIHGAAYGIARVMPDGRFVDANPALAEMLGYDTAAELMAVNFWTDIAGAAGHHTSAIGQSKDDRTRTGEERWKLRGGDSIMVRVSGRVARASAEGDTPPFELMVEDVTATRALEDRLRQAEKLDALGRLARGIVHDFNNLLTVIRGTTELIQEDLGADHAAQPDIRAVLDATVTAQNLTAQLLAFTRQQPVQPTEMALNDIITDTLTVLKRLIGAAVAFESRLAPSLPNVLVDRTQIQQVIMNLVVNARDAMPNGGRVTITTGASSSGDTVCLTLGDTGTGMTDDVRAHMFEPYFTTKEPGKGTGLRPGDRVRHRQAKWRRHQSDEYGGRRHDVFDRVAGGSSGQSG